MNQISFVDQLRKTKSSKMKRVQLMSKAKFTEPTHKKEYYLTIHNKIKVEYRNRQYKNVYQKLLKLQKPEAAYLSLYYEDLCASINKMIREYIVHKDLNITSNVQACLHQGKDNIMRLYKLFTFREEVTNQRKSVNQEMKTGIARFLNIVVSFLMDYAVVCTILNKKFQAKLLYDQLYNICSNILTSSTSNYKILRKIGQGLLVYSVHLIDNLEVDRAIKVLFQCLKNEMNLIIILSYRLKQKSRTQVKRRKLELFNRLYAIFFNLTHCFQYKQQLHWCYICLKECQTISDFKARLIQKDIKINWQDILRNYKSLYDEFMQIKKIVEAYFDLRELTEEIQMAKKYQQNHINNHEQTHKDLLSMNSFQKTNKVDVGKKIKKTARRSVSLIQNLQNQNNKRYFKDFGRQILFFGVNLFEKPVNKPKKIHTSVFKLRSTATVSHQEYPNDLLKQNQSNSKTFSKLDSKLKKKYKKVENSMFCRVQQPIQYGKLQDKFKKMWAQQQRINNRCKQKKFLLKYKSQYINYKQIAQENKSIYQQIQVFKNKNEMPIKEKKKVNEVQEQQRDKGIDLLKKIILRHFKKLDIKKAETLSVLKKKRTIKNEFQCYNAPNDSVNFLLEKLKKEKQKAQDKKSKTKDEEAQNLDRQRFKNSNCQNVFLTKDTVQIPNLFLSYINSSGFSGEVSSPQLEYENKF